MKNREIKFRAFNPKTKKFEFLDIVHMHTIMTSLPIPSMGAWECLKPFQQFTGLLDKNGEEIFEGDLVKVTWTDIYRKNDVTVEVKWNNGYHFPNSGAHTNDFEMEVIGNIFKRVEKV